MPNDPGRTYHLDKRAAQISAEGAGNPDDLLTTRQMAAWFGYSEQWFEIARSRGGGPPFFKMSPRRILYKRADALRWLEERKYCRTAEYTK